MARERDLGAHSFEIFLVLLMLGTVYLASLIVSHLETSIGLLLSLSIAVSILVLFKTSLAIYLLIFSMLLSPEIALPGSMTAGSTLGRGVTFRLDDFLLVIIGVAWLTKSALYSELGILKQTPLNFAMLAYICASVFSTLIGVAEGRVELMTGALFLLKYVQYFLIFFMVINNIDSEKQLYRYWLAVVATAVIVGTVGLWQVPTGGRVTAPFEGESAEPNTFGGYLCLLILLNLAVALSLQEFKKKLAYLSVAFFLFIPFLFTLSRASYLAFLPGVFLVLVMTKNRLLSYALVVAGLMVLIFPQVLPQAVRERIEFTWSQEERVEQVVLLGRRLDTSTSARLGTFQLAIDEFPNEPLFGHGVTGWRFIDAQYFRTLLETGIVGLMALLYLLYRLFRLGVERVLDFEHQPFYRGLTVGFVAGLVSLSVHAMGSNTFIIVRIMQPFWLITGMIFILGTLASRQSETQQNQPL